MKTLDEIYKIVIQENIWEYYPNNHIDTSIFQDCKKGKLFIKSYLEKGEKNILDIFKYIDDLDDNRIIHTLSTFFLGIYVFKKICTYSKFLETSNNVERHSESIEKRFLYIWMLTCFFHDFGYVVENGCADMTPQRLNAFISNMTNPRMIPKLYNKTLLRNYSRYRRCCFDVFDHGIVGGAKLFTDLCELREYMEYSRDTTHYWGNDLVEEFNLAAWVVATHNIYYEKFGSFRENCYVRFKLNKLLYEKKARKIQLDKHPLLYLLCLIDSIEPVKVFKNFDISKHVYIECTSDRIIVSLNMQDIKVCEFKKNKYISNICSLDSWFTDIENVNQEKFVINISHT